jgi:hypothetical protein
MEKKDTLEKDRWRRIQRHFSTVKLLTTYVDNPIPSNEFLNCRKLARTYFIFTKHFYFCFAETHNLVKTFEYYFNVKLKLTYLRATDNNCSQNCDFSFLFRTFQKTEKKTKKKQEVSGKNSILKTSYH